MSDKEKKFSAEFLNYPNLDKVEKLIIEKKIEGKNNKEIARDMKVGVRVIQLRTAFLLRLNEALLYLEDKGKPPLIPFYQEGSKTGEEPKSDNE